MIGFIHLEQAPLIQRLRVHKGFLARWNSDLEFIATTATSRQRLYQICLQGKVGKKGIECDRYVVGVVHMDAFACSFVRSIDLRYRHARPGLRSPANGGRAVLGLELSSCRLCLSVISKMKCGRAVARIKYLPPVIVHDS